MLIKQMQHEIDSLKSVLTSDGSQAPIRFNASVGELKRGLHQLTPVTTSDEPTLVHSQDIHANQSDQHITHDLGQVDEVTAMDVTSPHDQQAHHIKSLDETERETIIEALYRNNGRRKLTAQELKISERTLYRKIKQYGLERR